MDQIYHAQKWSVQYSLGNDGITDKNDEDKWEEYK